MTDYHYRALSRPVSRLGRFLAMSRRNETIWAPWRKQGADVVLRRLSRRRIPDGSTFIRMRKQRFTEASAYFSGYLSTDCRRGNAG